MALYNFQEDQNIPHIFGREDINYTKDPSAHDHRIETNLPHNGNRSRTIEECFAEKGTFYGVAPLDPAANAKIAEWFNNSFRNENVPHLLDLIIDMPVGMRTSDALSQRLRQFPLGLLSTLLKHRIKERGFNIALYHQLFYSGRINRIINDPAIYAVDNPDEPDNPEFHRLRTAIEKDISSMEDIFNFPLAKFELDLPLTSMDPTPLQAGAPSSHLLVTPQGGEQTTEFLMRVAYSDTGRLIAFNLRTYVDQVTRASGGSDRSFFLFGENGHITKRFEVFHDRNNSVSIRRARSIRTAGIRQVLLDDFCEEVQHREEARSCFTKVFVPGGLRNCFLACIRWSYVQICRDENTKQFLEESRIHLCDAVKAAAIAKLKRKGIATIQGQ